MKIIFVSRWFPYPANNGSKLRIFNLLTGLASRHEITLVSFFDPQEGMPNVEGLKTICSAIYPIPWQPFRPQSWRAVKGFFGPVPRFFVDTFSKSMANKISELISTQQFDLLIASQIDTAAYAPYFQGLPSLFEEVELGTLYEQYIKADSKLIRFRSGLTWQKYKSYLIKTLRYFRACTVVSDHEKQVLSKVVDDSTIIEIIPNCVDMSKYEGISAERQQNTLVFTGSFTYEPNYEAMVWFTRDVFPRILSKAPKTQLVITGNHANRPLPHMDQVVLTGFVDDIRSNIARAGCSIVPILSGGGTRLKTLEAIALNTPVVSTSKGAEGLDFSHGEHLLIANDANGFAEAVLTMMNDHNLRKYLSTNARRRMLERYNWSVEIPHFLSIVENIRRLQS